MPCTDKFYYCNSTASTVNACPACGKVYKHKHHLKRHREFECGVEPKFSCVYCPHKTRYKDSLTKHILARHEKLWNQSQRQRQRQQHQQQQLLGGPVGEFEPSVRVQLDTIRFYGYHRRLRSSESSSQLRSSNTTMGIPRRYLCADCGRMFGNRASLMRHRVYECEGCQQQPPQRQQQQAEQSISSVKRVSVPTRSKRKHVCSKCNKSYAFFTSLWRHQNYECGVEPRFGCTVCRAKFAQKSNLDRHIRARHSS
ncbi:hypothetical protein TSAR_012275 [Trichomalopsis sarcophagae]|uniref:C2H2-type domain-containing protein n=1 Tax=Trichomalopsis sarcophagae TaxID=543379 RepID=A0A232FN34_9HYME|nr:hypothetical protein TSAR_012275 [Trichomalopsis sarcophagae]